MINNQFTQNVLRRAGIKTEQQIPQPDLRTAPPERQQAEWRAAPPETFAQRVISRLPRGVQFIIREGREALFGDPHQRAVIKRAEERGIEIPFLTKMEAEGIFPFIGRTEIEKAGKSRESLINRGVLPERAEKIALAEVAARGSIPVTPEYKRWQELRKTLTPEEKGSVRMSRLGQAAGFALDFPFIPAGGIYRVSKPTLVNSLKASKRVSGTKNILRNAGVAEDIADIYAPVFTKLTDERQIARGLEKMEETRRVTRATAPIRPEPAIRPVEEVKPIERVGPPIRQIIDPVIPVPISKLSLDEPVMKLRTEINKIRGDKLARKIDANTAELRIMELNKQLKTEQKSLVDEGAVAMRTMRDGTKRPAIRKSGVFAPKEAETANIRDIRGISFNLNDLGLAAGDTPITKIPKVGELDFMPRMIHATNEATALVNEFGPRMAKKVQTLAKTYNVPLNEITGIQSKLYGFGLRNIDIKTKGAKQAIIDVLKAADISDEAISQALKPVGIFRKKESPLIAAVKDGIPESVQKLGDDIRKHYNELLNIVNPVRRSLGKAEIAFRENYTEAISKTNFWSRVRNKPKTEIVDNFDYIVPNAKKNPHALVRRAKAEDLEFNLWVSLSRYHEAIAQDMFHAPMIEQWKAVNEVFKGRNLPRLSKSIDIHLRENLVGHPSSLDLFFGLTPDSRIAGALDAVIRARNTAALAFNLVWTTFIQPASIVMTAARATVGGPPVVGSIYGPLNLGKGALKWFTKEGKERVMKLPTPRTKAVGKSIGATGAGDLNVLGGKIMRTKWDTIDEYLRLYADAMEYHMTGISASTGYEVAERLGIKGKNADFIADWLAGASQSRFNKEARALIQNSQLFRINFPFNTYLFEFYRFNKTLAGKPGGMPLEWTERINQAIVMLGGMYLYDRFIVEPALGRRLLTPSVFVPAIGEQVEGLLNQGARAIGITEETPVIGEFLGLDERERFGQPPTGALHRDIINVLRAIDTYARHGNIHPLRKEMTKWGMGFAGIGGAATLNRFIDGLIANTAGYQTGRTGERLFRIEGIDRYLSPLLGPYSTQAGISFFRDGLSIIEQDARKERKKLNDMPREEARDRFDDIMGKNPELARMINRIIEDEKNPILAQIRGLNNADKAEKIVKLFEDIPVEQRRDEYQKLIDAGEITQNVTNKYLDIIQKQEQAARGELPDLADGQERNDKSIISMIWLYARAIGTDPITAFNRIIAGETIRRVENGTIVIERLPFEESEKIKKERAREAELKNLRLDHIIPLQLGGSNREDNLVLVNQSEWRAYTSIENLLGDHLRAGSIERQEAQKLIKEFKEGKTSATEIIEKYPPFRGDAVSKYSKDFLEAYERGGVQGAIDFVFTILDDTEEVQVRQPAQFDIERILKESR